MSLNPHIKNSLPVTSKKLKEKLLEKGMLKYISKLKLSYSNSYIGTPETQDNENLDKMQAILLSYIDLLQYWQKTINESFNYSITLAKQLNCMITSSVGSFSQTENNLAKHKMKKISSATSIKSIHSFVEKINADKLRIKDQFLKAITSLNHFPLYSNKQEPIVITFDSTTQHLIVYDIFLQKCRKYYLNNLDMPEIISINKSIYLIGGAIDCKKCTQYNLNTNALDNLAPMKNARSHHCLECLANVFIYVVGGFNGDYMNSCERYNIKDNKWGVFSSTLMSRDRASLIQYKYKYLYFVGGQTIKAERLNCIERINLFKMGKWKLLSVALNIHWCGTENSGISLLPNGGILLFGGTDKFVVRSKYGFVITPNKEGIESIEFYSSLSCEDSFCSPCTLFDSCVYVVSESMRLYIINTQDKKCAMKEKDEWLLT